MLTKALIVFSLLICASCALFEDNPRYTADQVLIVAKNYAPGCRIGSPDLFKPTGSYEPRLEVEYKGKSMWEVKWYCIDVHGTLQFDEKTGKMTAVKQ